MLDARDDRLHQILLGREVGDLLTAGDRRAFRGECVLVTGAGGTIGSALALEIARADPGRLVLVDQSEYGLFSIEREVRRQYPALAVESVLADVTRRRAVHDIWQTTRPDVVYHAAAYKHVTMCERAIGAAVRTNVFGTQHAFEASTAVGARFVLISTDKAASPRSVMGATKRLAELLVLARQGAVSRPIVVRFGNVLGSSGSLLELVLDSVQRERPVQVTHREATRYFMTPREAVSLVMKADLMGDGGKVYWLDMGAPINVLDLVRRTVAAAVEHGAPPVPIEFIGLRPGEKLREELTSQGLELCRTPHPRIWSARQVPFDPRVVRRVLHALQDDVRRDDPAKALLDLQAAVPDFIVSDATWQAALARATSDASLSLPNLPVLRIA